MENRMENRVDNAAASEAVNEVVELAGEFSKETNVVDPMKIELPKGLGEAVKRAKENIRRAEARLMGVALPGNRRMRRRLAKAMGLPWANVAKTTRAQALKATGKIVANAKSVTFGEKPARAAKANKGKRKAATTAARRQAGVA